MTKNKSQLELYELMKGNKWLLVKDSNRHYKLINGNLWIKDIKDTFWSCTSNHPPPTNCEVIDPIPINEDILILKIKDILLSFCIVNNKKILNEFLNHILKKDHQLVYKKYTEYFEKEMIERILHNDETKTKQEAKIIASSAFSSIIDTLSKIGEK